MKKIAITSTGTAIVRENGTTRKASDAELGEYLQSIVPPVKRGAKLAAVKYENGYVFAKYDNGKVFKKVIAQNNSTQQQEPINSGDKSDPDLKTPRSEKHSKPETKEITKDRPDVAKPTEIRDPEYGRGGDKGAKEHKDGIPRSTGNSGLEGSKKTTFEKEKADKATSGNADTYVQKLYNQIDPTKSGNADNHATAGVNTASSDGLKIKSDSELYQKISIAKDDKDEKDEKTLPPWLKKDKKDKGEKGEEEKDGKDDGKEDEEESDKDEKESEKEAKLVQELQRKLAETDKTIATLKAEVNRYKVREARQIPAMKLALAFRDSNPEQFPTIEAVASKVTELCKQMNSDALESTFEQVKAIKIANAKSNAGHVKTASIEGASTAFSTPLETISEASGNAVDSLREALMGNTALGKKVAQMEAYNNSIVNQD